MTSSFSPKCLRKLRTSASSSRMRCCSRLSRLACPIWIPDAFSQLRSVSMQIPSSLATSVGCRPCSVTNRTAPALNASSYRGGAVPFFTFFVSISLCPFPFQFTTFFSVCQFGYGGTFEILEGENSLTLLSGEESPDILGTCYDHTLSVEPDPQYPGDYDSFFQAISAPVASHTITMPHGQGTITYRARVTGGSHVSRYVMAGVRRWSGLQVQFKALAPQREA